MTVCDSLRLFAVILFEHVAPFEWLCKPPSPDQELPSMQSITATRDRGSVGTWFSLNYLLFSGSCDIVEDRNRMALQATLGSSALVAAGIGVSDVATIVTLARRLGNWYTAEKGDAELFALLEEDEYDVLKRRGIIDVNRFQPRWNKKMRPLENGRPKRLEGKQVERLLSSSSNWTPMMTCIVAALDESASASLTQNICKGLPQRIFSSRDGVGMTEDVLSSSLQTRLNG
jgi:hypothetical protein